LVWYVANLHLELLLERGFVLFYVGGFEMVVNGNSDTRAVVPQEQEYGKALDGR